jgi:N utilization substance protein B
MGKRRDGRLAAVQYLFASELQGEMDDAAKASFWEMHQVKSAARDFAVVLVEGVLAKRDELDAEITPLLEKFQFDRLGLVDKNVMRMAAFELAHNQDVPTAIVLNEAIEVAKMLGTGESSGFVNAILHKLAGKLRGDATLENAAADEIVTTSE